MSPSGSIAILTYHSLDDSGSVLSTEPWRFAEQMQSLAEQSCQVVSLAEASLLVARSLAAEPFALITIAAPNAKRLLFAYPL